MLSYSNQVGVLLILNHVICSINMVIYRNLSIIRKSYWRESYVYIKEHFAQDVYEILTPKLILKCDTVDIICIKMNFYSTFRLLISLTLFASEFQSMQS